MSHGQETITIVKNADTGLPAYRYHDRHVDDTQGTASFLSVQNGWRASYLLISDAWRVTTPSGLVRTYTRER